MSVISIHAVPTDPSFARSFHPKVARLAIYLTTLIISVGCIPATSFVLIFQPNRVYVGADSLRSIERDHGMKQMTVCKLHPAMNTGIVLILSGFVVMWRPDTIRERSVIYRAEEFWPAATSIADDETTSVAAKIDGVTMASETFLRRWMDQRNSEPGPFP